jgi:hypothetical protein
MLTAIGIDTVEQLTIAGKDDVIVVVVGITGALIDMLWDVDGPKITDPVVPSYLATTESGPDAIKVPSNTL